MPAKECSIDSLGDKLSARLFLPDHILSPVPCILLVHGAIDKKEHFFELANYFCKMGFAALALDMHGHGGSEGERFHVRMDQWVPDLEAAIAYLESVEEVDANRVGIFGFSSGGTAALELAAKTHRVKALVTLDATVCTIVNRFEELCFLFLSQIGRIKRRWTGRDLHLPLYRVAIQSRVACCPEVNQAFLTNEYLKAGYTRYPLPGALESIVTSTLSRVHRIACPVCVMHGAEDNVDSPDSARKLYSALTSVKELHILPNSGHVGHLDYAKDTVMAISTKWFDQHL